jgi:Tol biopolymer transport system component
MIHRTGAACWPVPRRRAVPLPLPLPLLLLIALPGCSEDTGCGGSDLLSPRCELGSVAEGIVVFQSNRNGPMEVYTMNSDGTGAVRLTNNPGIDGGARWSPDGRRIVFSSLRAGAREIWVMNTDGSAQQRLTSLGNANMPDWSPDGSRIAFHTSRGDGEWDVYVMNADGTALRRLTSTNSLLYPRWSRDGRQLLASWYESAAPCPCVAALPQCPCGGRLALLDPENGSFRLLPPTGMDDAWGDWSPDGRQIVFASHFAAPGQAVRTQIMVASAGGTGARTLTNSGMDEWSPSWSAATGRIFFVRGFDIYSMRTDGSDVQRLSAMGATDVVVHSR